MSILKLAVCHFVISLTEGDNMTKKPNSHSNSNSNYDHLVHWFDDLKSHELTHVIELVEEAKKWVKSAESIPEEKYQQFIANFKLDLIEFYQQSQSDIQHSLYLQLLKESFWKNLACVTDQARVEWAELQEDFVHDGLYKEGDYIGFGDVECLSCHHVQQVHHVTILSSCIKCNGNTFRRKSLTP